MHGRRIAKISKNGESYRTLYHSNDSWIDFDVSGAVKNRYLFGDNVDQILARERASGALAWYATNELGTINRVVDAHSSDNPGAHYSYTAFGKNTVEGNTDMADRFRFTGREWDEETELYYYRARYYDPHLGRFISSDPARFKGGSVNLYAYVDNKPINYVDPSGQSAVEYLGPSGMPSFRDTLMATIGFMHGYLINFNFVGTFLSTGDIDKALENTEEFAKQRLLDLAKKAGGDATDATKHGPFGLDSYFGGIGVGVNIQPFKGSYKDSLIEYMVFAAVGRDTEIALTPTLGGLEQGTCVQLANLKANFYPQFALSDMLECFLP
jgi:RHS repeat-associated protein